MKKLTALEARALGSHSISKNPLVWGVVVTVFTLFVEFMMENLKEAEYILFQANQRKQFPFLGEAYHDQILLQVYNLFQWFPLFVLLYVIWISLKKYTRWGYGIAICFGTIILMIDFMVFELIIRRSKYDLSFWDESWWLDFYDSLWLSLVLSFFISLITTSVIAAPKFVRERLWNL